MGLLQKTINYWRCEFCGYEWPVRNRERPPLQCANFSCNRRGWFTGIPQPMGPKKKKARILTAKKHFLTGSEVLERLKEQGPGTRD